MACTKMTQQLIQGWEREVHILRNRGAGAQAETMESCIADLRRQAEHYEKERLTLQAASQLGGYSVSQLQRHLTDGVVPNHGREGAPRILRCNVPRKPGHKVIPLDAEVASEDAEEAPVKSTDPAVADALRKQGLEIEY